MEEIKFIYSGKEVDFLPQGSNNVMVNATQMAKIFGKKVEDFTRLDSTKAFTEAWLRKSNLEQKKDLKNGISRFLNPNSDEKTELKSEISHFLTKKNLIISKQKSGTWMHRILALKFAAWLNPDFEVWVYETIDRLLFENFKEQKEATEAKLRAEAELEAKKKELLEKYPEFIEFLNIEGKVSDAEKRRIKAIRESAKQLKLELFT
jgi:predicted site-specific integrase-resolvase